MPKLLALGRPGLDGVEGEANDGVVAGPRCDGKMGDRFVTRDGSACPRWLLFRLMKPCCADPYPGVSLDPDTAAAARRSKAEIGALNVSFLIAMIVAARPLSSLLSLRKKLGLLRPSRSEILRNGVGMDSVPPGFGTLSTFVPLLL